MSDALAEYAPRICAVGSTPRSTASLARCLHSHIGGDYQMELLLSGRTMVLPGMSDALADLAAAAARCAGSRV